MFIVQYTKTDVNHATDLGDTALMYATGRNCAEIVRVLLNGGADANAANRDGCTSLQHALEKEYTDIADLLIAAGAKE